jgi:hypothetical protein
MKIELVEFVYGSLELENKGRKQEYLLQAVSLSQTYLTSTSLVSYPYSR